MLACGTSLGAPVWAGIAELIRQANGQQPLGSINTRLYQLGNLQDTAATGIRDTKKGNNDFNGVTGFDAVAGFDQASGWGTPDVTTFVSAFIAPDTIKETLTFSPTALKFTGTAQGKTSKPVSLTIKNASSGSTATLVSIVSQSAPAPFAVSQHCTTTVLPGKSCKAMVTFSPTDTMEHQAQLSIIDNLTGEPQMVSLTGTGKAVK